MYLIAETNRRLWQCFGSWQGCLDRYQRTFGLASMQKLFSTAVKRVFKLTFKTITAAKYILKYSAAMNALNN